MNVKIGSRWEAMVAEAISSGRYTSEEDVLNESLRLLEEKEGRFREMKRLIDQAYEDEGVETTEDVIAAVDAALADLKAQAPAK